MEDSNMQKLIELKREVDNNLIIGDLNNRCKVGFQWSVEQTGGRLWRKETMQEANKM